VLGRDRDAVARAVDEVAAAYVIGDDAVVRPGLLLETIS
jgi:hypothetical protein